MKIFYSWQSDLSNSTNRSFIRKCLDKTIQELKLQGDISEAVREDMHIDQDTEGVPGSPDIAKTILEKIDRSAIFIADITPIKEIEKQGRKKSIPNPNVMLELGYAMAKLGPERVILILNDALWCGDLNSLPFDFRFRRISTRYILKEGEEPNEKAKVKLKLIKSLKIAISNSPSLTETTPTTETVFNRIKRNETDSALWQTKTGGIQLPNYYDGADNNRKRTSNSPKAYMRITPASWPNGIPKRATLRKEENRGKLLPFGDWSSMDYAPNDDGYISYEPPHDDELENATQWFKKNGEIWGFDAGTRVSGVQANGKRYLNYKYIIECWARFLNHFDYLRELGCSKPYYVEAGITNILDTTIQINVHRNAHCLEKDIVFKQELSGSPESLREYMQALANELADAFGLEGQNLYPSLWAKK